MSMMTLLDFWALRRSKLGQKTTIKKFHRKKAEVLTDLLLGQIPTPNLMILEPPRIGKTDLGTKAFMGYGLSWFPDSEFIHGSWGSDLATDNVRSVRNTLCTHWYRSIIRSDFGAHVKLTKGSPGRQDFFYTEEGGSVKAVGAGTGVIGFGAGKLREAFGGCIMIDDPLKEQDKDSPTVRKSTIDWLDGLESRRNRKKDPMTPIVLIMQRLHPNDPAGYYLSSQRHRWTVVQLPALDENNNSIWEEKISKKELMHMKIYDPDRFWAVYMQNPQQENYYIFIPDWWQLWTDRKEVERRITLKIITADTAFKDEESSDFSVFQCWGFEGTKGAYLLDQIRGKWIFPDLVKYGREFVQKHTDQSTGFMPATEAWVEDRASGTSLVQTLRREGLFFRQWLPPNNDQKIIDKSQNLAMDKGRAKAARAKQCTMPISAGRVFLPHPSLPGYEWVEHFVGEHTAFTSDDSHVHDDQVDTETTALLIWQQRGGGTGVLPQWEKGKVIPWKAFEESLKYAV